MKKTDVRQFVLVGLDSVAKRSGFCHVRAGDDFLRSPRPGWEEGFRLFFVTYAPTTVVETSAAIRIEPVEAILRAASTRPMPRQYTWTLEVPISRLEANRPIRGPSTPEIEGAADIPGAVETLAHALERVALPFFQRIPDLSAANALLNDAPTEFSYYSSGWFERSARGLILAHICDDPRYDSLLKTYRSIMKTKPNQFSLPEFEAVVTELTRLRGESPPVEGKASPASGGGIGRTKRPKEASVQRRRAPSNAGKRKPRRGS